MKRIGGAPDRLGASRWAPAAPPSAASRDGARPPTCATSASTSTSRRCSTSPGPAATSPRPNAASARRAARVAATAIPFAEACRTAASPPPPSTSRGSAAPASTPTSPSSGCRSPKPTLRGVDEAPYRRFVAVGGEMVMLSTRDLPGLLAEAGRLRAVDRHRRAARPPRLRGGLDHRRARAASPSPTSAAGEGRGSRRPRRHRPAALHRLPGGARRAADALCAELRSGSLAATDFEPSAGRVLRLRHRLAGG